MFIFLVEHLSVSERAPGLLFLLFPNSGQSLVDTRVFFIPASGYISNQSLLLKHKENQESWIKSGDSLTLSLILISAPKDLPCLKILVYLQLSISWQKHERILY
jgi:hypothetical protein